MARIAAALCLAACLLFSAQAAVVKYDAALASVLASMNVHAESLQGAAGGRALLQESGEGVDVQQCIWNEQDKQCGLSPIVAIDFVAQAPSSPIKNMLLSIVKCSLTIDEEKCKGNEQCAWDEGECAADVDVSNTESISDCVGKDVSAFLEAPEKFAECSQHKSAEVCNIQRDCGWAEAGDQKICAFDIWKSLTGVPSTFGEFPLPRGLKEIEESRAAVLEKAVDDANVNDTKAILDVEVPPFECPDGMDYVVCNIAEEADVLLLTQLYCQKRLASDGVCTEDKLCGDVVVLDGKEHCEPADAIFLAMRVAQREKYLEAISDPVAQAIMRNSLQCLETGTTEGNCKEGCLWNAQMGVCNLGPSILLKELSNQNVQRGGIECQVVQGIFGSGCLTLENQEACDAKAECGWDEADGFCTAGPLAYMDILFSHDKALQNEVAERGFECSQMKNSDECNSV
ncbi:unnamed protein product [Ostreobium quekettii]|uniref:Uncharacterized protein n=1 Tax=Ostreobium quekettii TaxID=121088 RepID=A0A8S1IKZ3_9CHLO|nr:unnamed protein product [Ostreobium quekettii]|eukprot:evm.model.scf_1463.2 EVM.evm.TU.scf_1463.2   scf_1463:20581-30770(-)